MAIVTIAGWQCESCSYVWMKRAEMPPARCPQCRTWSWNDKTGNERRTRELSKREQLCKQFASELPNAIPFVLRIKLARRAIPKIDIDNVHRMTRT